MANIYVRSTDGSDADNGSTWALAKTTLANAATIEAAGDTVYISSAHAESVASNVLVALAGTNNNPVKLLSVNDAAEPPNTLAVGASIVTTGASSIDVHGAGYLYGLTLSAGSGGVNVSLLLNSNGSNANKRQTYEKCKFIAGATGTGSFIQVNGGGANAQNCETLWKDCDIRATKTSNSQMSVTGSFIWQGGSILPGHVASSSGLIASSSASAGRAAYGTFSGLDLSNLGVSQAIFAGSIGSAQFVISNSKLPASWSGALVSGTIGIADRFEMHNCDSADTNYRLWVADYAGSIKSETTVVRTGGANDGSVGFAWRMVSGAENNFPLLALVTPGLPARWNSAVGDPLTITVDILHDSLTNLKDDEVWLEVEYLGTSGFPLSIFKSDAKVSVLATASDQTVSDATWTTTGLTNPNKQQLSVTITPQEVGYFQARVHLAKASYMVFVDPKLTVS